MDTHSVHKKIFFRRLLIIPLLVLLGVLSIEVISDVRYLRNKVYSSSKYFLNVNRRKPATLSDVSHISSWMTFNYINKVFDLPDTYLKDALNIENSKYPYITIQRYAKESHINAFILVGKVQMIVSDYMKNRQLK